MSNYTEKPENEIFGRAVMDITNAYKGWNLKYKVLSEEEFLAEYDNYIFEAVDIVEEKKRRQQIIYELKDNLEKET